jgi:hypothetical protein
MGADYEGQDRAIDKLKRHLSEEERQVLSHHLRNALSGIIGGLQTGQYEMAEKEAWHMVRDLEEFGL